MRTYELKEFLPAWHPKWYFDPATNRQLKVLRFFGVPIDPPPAKGRASGLIWRLCSEPANKHLWLAYLYTTCDEDDSTSELLPCDRAELARVVIPDGWQPKRSRHPTEESHSESSAHNESEKLVADLMEERSPFDDPLPQQLSIPGRHFCFTGAFEFGTRNKCREAVQLLGGLWTDEMTNKTDVLVIGEKGSSTWSHRDYGNKIEAAILSRMRCGKPVIIPEKFWAKLLKG
jgi:hypothetical protein